MHCQIDTGVKGVNFLSTDRFTIETTRWYRESEQKLKELQRAIDKKRLSRLILWLNHPDNTIEHVKDVFSTISKDSLILAMQCKTPQQLSVLFSENKLSGLAYNRLKWYDFKRCRLPSCFLFDKLLSETSRERELVQKRGWIFEKQKRQRRVNPY